MEDLKMPQLINTPDIPINPRKTYRFKSEYVGEYIKETEKLLIKTNIMNILTFIEDCVEPMEINKMMCILKNTIILHSKTLATMPEFITKLERTLKQHTLCYDIYVIYKMIYNITNGDIQDNIHFRYVDENIRKYPPIPQEDRSALEQKIKYMRFSYQAKKKHEAFKVGQIVGAKDKENKWWLSRVLYVFNDPERSGFWYYIRFEGWGPIHDEWIYSETYRVKWFNPRRHFLKK